MVSTHLLRGAAVLVVLSSLAACGGGGGGGGGTPDPQPQTYTVGGTVTGLTGTGLTLRNNGGNTLAVAANGAFTFSTAIASGSSYSVTVASQPSNPTQVCTVANGSGTITANVINVAITCATDTHTVGGTVSGLTGSGLTLQNSGGDTLAVAADGAFTFSTPIANGASYSVTVASQPSNPTQVCTVANSSGTITANVTNVAITCATETRTVGGTVAGLIGTGLTLQNNGGDTLAVSANGAFVFSTAIASGSLYSVTVASQPSSPAQVCTVANGSGTIAANVTNVAVTCATETRTVGATVSGLTGSGLVLSNGSDQVTVNTDGAIVFASAVSSGGSYNVLIDTAPSNPVQRCTVTNGSGTVTNANVSVTVTCVATFPTFAYSINTSDGTVSSHAIDAATGQLRSRFNAKAGDTPLAAVTFTTGNGDQFSYVVNQDSDNISGFAADPRTGALDEVALSPFATGGVKPNSLVLHPTLPFLYAPNEDSANIAAFTINQITGALTQAGPVATGATPSSFVIEASGRFAYAAAPGSSELYTYAIDQSTGALTEVASSRVTIGTSTGGIALERSGKFLYLFNAAPGTISAFAINAATGVLTPIAGSPFTAGPNAAFAAMHPNGKFLYVKHSTQLQNSADGLSVFAIDAGSGAPSEVAGSPFDTSTNPVALSFDPTGKYLYVGHLLVVGAAQSDVRAYAVNASSGALTVVPGSPFASSLFPSALDVDGSGKYLYVTNRVSNQLTSYSIDSLSGALTPLPGTPANVGAAPTFVDTAEDTTALQLLSKFVYTIDGTGNSISAFDIDADGLLALAAQPATLTGAAPHGLTLDPKGRYAYVANTTANTISIYSVDPQDGALTPLAGSPVATGLAPTYIVIEPSGRYAYVAVGNSNSIERFTIDQDTGLLSSSVLTLVGAGESVHVMALSPNGKALHVATTSDVLLRTYPIDPATGALGVPTDVNTVAPVTAMAVDPSGKVLYATDAPNGLLKVYSISSLNSTLAPLASYPRATPHGVAFDPTGRFAFVAGGVANSVSMFEVLPSGAASHLADYPAGNNPLAVTTDYSGNFVIVMTGAGELQTFAIDRNAATLTSVDAISALPGVLGPGTVTTSSHAQ